MWVFTMQFFFQLFCTFKIWIIKRLVEIINDTGNEIFRKVTNRYKGFLEKRKRLPCLHNFPSYMFSHMLWGLNQSSSPVSSLTLRVMGPSFIPNSTVGEHMRWWLSYRPWFCWPLADFSSHHRHGREMIRTHLTIFVCFYLF